MLKTAVLGDDMRPHHMLFSKDDDHEEVYKLIFVVTSSSLWLSEDLSDKIREFNRLVFSDGGSDSGLVEFGKIRYKEIAELRTALERYHARDMLTLHDVPKFLERKKFSDSYIPIGRRS
ncbi:MAG: hypothetical protein DWQ11_07905 [Proteobacteria bacterium]|nr:MAG: hypothetical protein DWQ11_07905 [Pseudomonadota bacterium]